MYYSLALINSDRPQRAGLACSSSIFNEPHRRARRSSLHMKSRMNEVFFSFFACSQRRRAAPGPLKLTCHSPASPFSEGADRARGKITKSVLAASRSESGRQSAIQYGIDGRSFNINCGFSADGNVFYRARYVVMKWPARCLWRDLMCCGRAALLRTHSNDTGPFQVPVFMTYFWMLVVALAFVRMENNVTS